MSNIKSLFLILFSFTFLLSSCKNEDDIIIPAQQKIISKITRDAGNYTTFDYLDGKLSKYDGYANGGLITSIVLDYNGSMRPQSELYKYQNEEILKKYFYNSSSLLDSMEFSFKDSLNNFEVIGYMKYSYNQSNQLNKTVQYTTSNSIVMSTEYYYDASGNVIERRYYLANQLDAIYTNTFDSKINPLNYLKNWLNYDISMNKNNILSTSAVFVNNNQFNSEMIYNYVYDSEGYPISSIANYYSSTDSTIINQTYEYK
jgi:hypothetical protein